MPFVWSKFIDARAYFQSFGAIQRLLEVRPVSELFQEAAFQQKYWKINKTSSIDQRSRISREKCFGHLNLLNWIAHLNCSSSLSKFITGHLYSSSIPALKNKNTKNSLIGFSNYLRWFQEPPQLLKFSERSQITGGVASLFTVLATEKKLHLDFELFFSASSVFFLFLIHCYF